MAKAKTGLGRGLDALIPDVKPQQEQPENEDTAPVMLRLSLVEPNRDQPRKQFNDESLDELAQSIKQYGVIQPIIVCKNGERYEIVAGERRWRAARKAGLKEIPVLIKEYSREEIAEISLIENIQREDLSPIEEARAYRQLIEDHGLTQEALAQRVSKSRTAIANTMRLLNLHPEVQEMLSDGRLSAGHARALLAVENGTIQLELAGKVVEGALSVRQTEDLVKFYKIQNKPGKTRIKNDENYRDLEKKLTCALGTRVRIKQNEQGRGRIEISYYTEEQLDQIYKMLNRAGTAPDGEQV